MKTMLRTAALGALALASTTANADVICDKCAPAKPGVYLGAYWPGDRGTFQRAVPLPAPTGPFDNDYFVVDLMTDGILTLAINGGASISVQWDSGSVCDATPGTVCAEVVPYDLWGSTRIGHRAHGAIYANRYVLRVNSYLLPAGTVYRGTISFRKGVVPE